MPTKPLFTVLVGFIACFSIGVFVFRRVPVASAQTARSFKPFSGTYNVIDYAPDNAITNSELRGFAVRSNGSNVESFYRPSPTQGSALVSINVVTDLATQKATRVAPFITTKVTFSLTTAEVDQIRAQASATCSGDPAESILGYKVVKLHEVRVKSATNHIPYDRIERDRWFAPDLNCLPLRTETTFIRDQKAIIRRVATYLNLKEGEPDNSLFEIPGNYVERTPSGAAAEAARLFPNDPRFGRLCDMSPQDLIYQNSSRTRQ